MLQKTLQRTIARSSMLSMSAQTSGSRRMNRFEYPHSYQGANSALTNIPQKNVYPELKRDGLEPGDKANYAHQNVRVFPDWYKPYGFNYQGEGWLAVILGGFVLCGYSYFNDIAELKGRKSRKVYPLLQEDMKPFKENFKYLWARDQVEKGNPDFVKYTVHKERAAAHH